MHRYTADTERLAEAVLAYASSRLQMDPVPLDAAKTPAELAARVGETITPAGLGGIEVLGLFERELAPACISVDHPRYLSFIPAAPTEASFLFDLVVAASSIYGGSWLEGSGAIYAENQALRWIADVAGMPASAGGVFVAGGTQGNLSALVAARHAAGRGRQRPERWKVAATDETHSSVHTAAAVMDVDVIGVRTDDAGRMRGADLRTALDGAGDGVFAVVATAGTTNVGLVDRLDEVAQVCAERGVWFHVDGAYGGAALCAPSVRERFLGIEHCDSLIVDPHKWLFAPFDCCALLYRDPAIARDAHVQRAGYLEVLHVTQDWDPSDYAIHLSRRARGLPFWFSLAAHGTDAYTAAVETTLTVARAAADEIRRRSYVELLHEPDLSVLMLRRIGWDTDDYYAWSRRLMQSQFAFVMPTTHRGETVTRFAIVNPRTTEADIAAVLDTMA